MKIDKFKKKQLNFINNLFFGGSFMNKKNLALVIGLMLNIVPVCCAEEIQAIVQEPTEVVCTEDVCPVTEVAAPVSEATPHVESVQAPEVAPVSPVASDIQPEEELTEEQLKKLLDQILAEMKQEEANKQEAQAPVVQ